MKKYLSLFILTVAASVALAQMPYDPKKTDQKLSTLLQYIRYMYVDTVDLPSIVDNGIGSMLSDLDPHSSYIPAKDVEKANEQLVGNFEGVGVSFQLVRDTIVILEALTGGPSEKVGIMSGDKIVRIDGQPSVGDSVNNQYVFSKLRGKKGSKVELGIKRRNVDDIIYFKVTRDKIPLHSVDAWFMENKNTGYIRLDRFSRTTMDEISEALADLKKQGMKNLILDLRGNGGGYMDIAVKLADEFLKNDLLVVYMQGAAQKRQESTSTRAGEFEKGKLIILVDEGSASASEIVSGAIQDWDRGVIMGRRTFGKGLVQRAVNFPDGSEMRITIARYYTPSGRCIQKSYDNGKDDYYSDLSARYKHGEMVYQDSIKFPDSLKYYTHNKRVVYGGGGVNPDIFVPIDTTKASDFFIELRRKGVLLNYVNDYVESNREQLMKEYPDFNAFYKNYKIIGENYNKFIAYAEEQGIKRTPVRKEKAEYLVNKMFEEMKQDSALTTVRNYSEYMQKVLWDYSKMQEYIAKEAQKEDAEQAEVAQSSDKFIESQLKGLMARNLYGAKYYYQITKDVDDCYLKAVEVIENDKLFKKLGIDY